MDFLSIAVVRALVAYFLCLCTDVLRDLSNAWHPFFALEFRAPFFAAFILFAMGQAAAALMLLSLASLVAFGLVETVDLARGLSRLMSVPVATNLLGLLLRCAVRAVGFNPYPVIDWFPGRTLCYLWVLINVPVLINGFGVSSADSGSTSPVAALGQCEDIGLVPTSEPVLEDHGDQAKSNSWAKLPREKTRLRQLCRDDPSDSFPPLVAARLSDPAAEPGSGGRYPGAVIERGRTKYVMFIEPAVRNLLLVSRPQVDAACQVDDVCGSQGMHPSVSQVLSQPALFRKPLPLAAGAPEHTDFALETEAPQTAIPVVEEDVSAASLGDTAGPPDRGEPVSDDSDEGTPVPDSPAETAAPSATEDADLEGGINEEGTSVSESAADTAAPQATEDDAVGAGDLSFGSAGNDDTRPIVVNAACADLPLESSFEVPERFLVYRDCEDTADTSDTDGQADDGLVVSTQEFLEYEVSSSSDPAFALYMDSLTNAFSALFVDDSGRPEVHDNDDQTEPVTTEMPME